ncbi:Uncharacterized protein dnl_58880 [Desulfonema limicola]|uniref:Uncharacterized protein n=1 Tax=Desulfonema limicola TaxID=45656 RepID=A0A975BDU2_9BACT|nr:Uncharacterized protein dnl_58880 [Desulfonema limicola]
MLLKNYMYGNQHSDPFQYIFKIFYHYQIFICCEKLTFIKPVKCFIS